MDISALSAASANAAQSGATSQLSADFDTFLKLLTTQLQNQDPLDPLDTEKFTEQLVQFSAVEQSIETNTHLQTLIAMQAAGSRADALGFVGRTLTVETGRAMNGGTGAAWTYALPTAAAATGIAVVDASGSVVARLAGATGAGTHDVVWDGRTDAGEKAAPGVYRLVVEAKAADGADIEASIATLLRADAVRFSEDATLLETAIGLVSVDAVRRAGAES